MVEAWDGYPVKRWEYPATSWENGQAIADGTIVWTLPPQASRLPKIRTRRSPLNLPDLTTRSPSHAQNTLQPSHHVGPLSSDRVRSWDDI